MARKVGKWVAPYKHELKRIKDYAKKLTKRGYLIDLSFLPEAPKRITKEAVERLENISAWHLRMRAVRDVSGVKTTAEQEAKIRRSESAKKGWATRRRKKFEQWQEEPPDKYFDWINDDSTGEGYEDRRENEPTPFDEPYYPDEGPISFYNAAKTVGIGGDEFIRRCIRIIEDARNDRKYNRRADRYVKDSNIAGDILKNYMLYLLSDEEKLKNIYKNIIEAGQQDSIYTMINDMLFSDSKSRHSATTTMMAIQQIFEKASTNNEFSVQNAFMDWDSPY